MGFVKKPTRFDFSVRHYLIMGKPEGHLWGIDGQDSLVPCSEQAIEGVLLGFQLKEDLTYSGLRLLIFLEDPETKDVDCISSGFQNKAGEFTCFAKSFCLSLDKGFDATKPIILVPNKGKDPTSKPVFCSIYQQGRVKYTWDSKVDCLRILKEFSPSFPDVPLYPQLEEKAEPSANTASSVPSIPRHTGDALSPDANYLQSDSTISTIERAEVDYQLMITLQAGWISKLGWTKEQCVDFLKANYGKKSRQLLNDTEFLEFHNYLRDLANPGEEVDMQEVPF